MKLMYISEEAINDIKTNFNKYKSHFTDTTNEWFMKQFEKNDWIHESKIECNEFEMNLDLDYNISDRKNVEIVFGAMSNLSPALASDERLWAGILFSQLWEFVQYRRAKELASGKERDVLNSFFFLRGIKRSGFMNCLSRLWWTGFLLYDPTNENHYSAADLICESAYASNILLLSSNNFIANKNLALGVMDAIAERKKKGEKIGRYYFVEANKYLNCVGGTILLDMMSREEARKLVDKRLERYVQGK